MNANFNEDTQPELIEVENNPLEQPSYKGRFFFKGKSVLRNNLPESPKAGYGSCRACGCKGYISKHDGSHECKTCNHHFDRHN